MDDFIVKLATNGFYLVLLLVVLLLLFHWFFIKFLKFDKVKFKKLEYFYLTAALIGIIGVSSNLRIWWTSNELFFSKQYASSAYKWVREDVDNYYCMKFNKGALSPDNFDEIVNQHSKVCEWFKKVGETIPISGEKLPDISFNYFPQINIDDEFLLRELSRFKAIVEEYRTIREDYLRLKGKTKKNYFEIILSIFSPILLCIALALRITKVTGEIRIEEAKKSNSADAKSCAAD